MVDVEELMSKIKSGVWSTQDAFDCIKDLEQEYLQSSKTKEWREDYSLAAYFTSYGIFACSYRECVFPMIELCQKLLEDCPNSADQALYYLALMRLYFVTGFQPKIVEYGLKYVETGYADRMNLKSTYNSIVVAFTENDLFEEALYYLEKMIDVTRKDPAAEGVDFWSQEDFFKERSEYSYISLMDRNEDGVSKMSLFKEKTKSEQCIIQARMDTGWDTKNDYVYLNKGAIDYLKTVDDQFREYKFREGEIYFIVPENNKNETVQNLKVLQDLYKLYGKKGTKAIIIPYDDSIQLIGIEKKDEYDSSIIKNPAIFLDTTKIQNNPDFPLTG